MRPPRGRIFRCRTDHAFGRRGTILRKKDGTAFTRESERARWAYVEALEDRLLASKSVSESMHELELLYAHALQVDDADALDAARQARIDLQQRLRQAARQMPRA